MGRLVHVTKTSAADPTTGLTVARVQGDFLVHLVAHPQRRSLCGQSVRANPPHKSFREAGCATCAAAAIDAGHLAVLDGERSWINLRRLQLAGT